MRCRGFLAVALPLASAGVLTCGAGPAAAASRPSAGWYGGKAGGAVIGFRVTAGRSLRDLRVGRVTATCSDGIGRTVGIRPGATGTRSASVRSGRISWRTSIGDDEVGGLVGRATLSGRFSTTRKAVGTLRVTFTWPSGATCRTATLRVSAARRSSAPAVAVLGYRIFVGRSAAGQPLELALAGVGNAVRVARMRAEMSCTDSTTVTLDVMNPFGPDVGVTPEATYAGSWRFSPPSIPGHPPPSGGGVEISGRVTPTGLDGAIRMTMGFTDGIACDGGWTRFTLVGNTAAG